MSKKLEDLWNQLPDIIDNSNLWSTFFRENEQPTTHHLIQWLQAWYRLFFKQTAPFISIQYKETGTVDYELCKFQIMNFQKKLLLYKILRLLQKRIPLLFVSKQNDYLIVSYDKSNETFGCFDEEFEYTKNKISFHDDFSVYKFPLLEVVENDSDPDINELKSPMKRIRGPVQNPIPVNEKKTFRRSIDVVQKEMTQVQQLINMEIAKKEVPSQLIPLPLPYPKPIQHQRLQSAVRTIKPLKAIPCAPKPNMTIPKAPSLILHNRNVFASRTLQQINRPALHLARVNTIRAPVKPLQMRPNTFQNRVFTAAPRLRPSIPKVSNNFLNRRFVSRPVPTPQKRTFVRNFQRPAFCSRHYIKTK